MGGGWSIRPSAGIPVPEIEIILFEITIGVMGPASRDVYRPAFYYRIALRPERCDRSFIVELPVCSFRIDQCFRSESDLMIQYLDRASLSGAPGVDNTWQGDVICPGRNAAARSMAAVVTVSLSTFRSFHRETPVDDYFIGGVQKHCRSPCTPTSASAVITGSTAAAGSHQHVEVRGKIGSRCVAPVIPVTSHPSISPG